MAIQVTTLVRKFLYNGIRLADPSPDQSPDEVKKLFAFQYPELTNSVIEGPETKGGVSTYKFVRAVGSKGAKSHLAAITAIAKGKEKSQCPIGSASLNEIKENKQCSMAAMSVVNNSKMSQVITPVPLAYSHFG